MAPAPDALAHLVASVSVPGDAVTAGVGGAGHRTPDLHDCFLMNCADLGPEVVELQSKLVGRSMGGQGWIRIRSWHAILTPTRVPDRYVTMCGRRASGPTAEHRPAGKSCETCLRNLEWLSEKPAEDDVTEFLDGPA